MKHVLTAVVVGLGVAIGAGDAIAAGNCSIDGPDLTVNVASSTVVATLDTPPRTKVTLSVDGDAGFHRELTWAPDDGDGLQHEVLLSQGNYKIAVSVAEDRIQSGTLLLLTRFTSNLKSRRSDQTAAITITPQITAITADGVAKEIDKPPPPPATLTLNCDLGRMPLSTLRLETKQLYAASVARGFLDQTAPSIVTETLALLAEIAVERGQAAVMKIAKDHFVEPICTKLTLELLRIGPAERAFPRTCTILTTMRLGDLLSSGRALLEAARDDLRLTILPALIDKAGLPAASRDVAVLALELGNELLDGGGASGAELDLLISLLDRAFFAGAAATSRTLRTAYVTELLASKAVGLEYVISQVLRRALPDDPGELISQYVADAADSKLADRLLLAGTPACARKYEDATVFVPADKAKCVEALAAKLAAESDWLERIETIATLDDVVALISAAASHKLGKTFEEWIEESLPTRVAATFANAVPTPALRGVCGVRLVIGVVKWCSARDSCKAGDIATAIDNPEALFAPVPEHVRLSSVATVADSLCWTNGKLNLPTVRRDYIELATRALTFLMPPAKGEENKRVEAVLRWMFDLAKSIATAESPSKGILLGRLEEVIELMMRKEYVRALGQSVHLAVEISGCADAKCPIPEPLRKATVLIGTVASYLQVYDDTKALDPAEAKAARKKALESLIDESTDRTSRASNWILSLGSPVGAFGGWKWTPGTSGAGYSSADFGNAFVSEGAVGWRVPLALAFQRMPSSWSYFGFHAAATFADLGNFLRGRAHDQSDDIHWKDFVEIGGQLGVLIGSGNHAVVVAGEISWSPGLYEREVKINNTDGTSYMKELSGALTLGFTVAYYVPFLDFN